MSQAMIQDWTLDSKFCLELSDREAEVVKGGVQQTEPVLVGIPPKPKPLVLLFPNPFGA